MEKKIIAVALVLVLMVTAFVGCTQKYKTTNLNGTEYLLATDVEGNTIINDKNQIAAVVTDAEGEIQTHSNGEEQTYLVQLSDAIIINGIARGTNYKINVPQGWRSIGLDRIAKDGTEDNCYIQFAQLFVATEENNLETHISTLDTQNEQLVDALAKNGYTYTIDKSEMVLTADNIKCYEYVCKIVDEDENLFHYAQNYYFTMEGTVYKLSYICEEGMGYDETFNFRSFVDENFTYLKETQ